MAKSKTVESRPVVVCTAYKGVFFGYAADTSGDVIHLKRARMCIKWEWPYVRGVMGLAETGPAANSLISGRADSIEIRKITAVMEMTEDAVKAWEDAK